MVKKKKVTRKVTKRAAAPARSEVAPQGRRFDETQKQHALVLVASGVSRVQVAATIGTTTESLRPDFEKLRHFGGTHHSNFAGLAACEARKA